jgi:MFS family permease
MSSVPASQALAPRTMTIFATAAAITFSACGSAPTPVYHFYQETLGLSPFLLTLIFATYAFSLLAALLTVGSLSDYVGRRPVILGALAMNVLAQIAFLTAHSAEALVAARAVQGLATGAAITSLAAAILDSAPRHGPLLNSITPFIGLTIGTLGAGLLVTFAPAPDRLVFLVLLAVSLVLALALIWVEESAEGKPGALASLKPHVRVPPQARRALAQVTPVNIAAWALGGFYFSLMPSLVRIATGVGTPLAGAVVVGSLTLTASVIVVFLRGWSGERALGLGSLFLAAGVAVTLVGVGMHAVALLLAGTVVAGVGFGGTFAGTIRTVVPLAEPDQRAGLLAAFFVQSYLAFSLPAILAGLLAPMLGLPLTTYLYGGAAILLALASAAALRPRPARDRVREINQRA